MLWSHVYKSQSIGQCKVKIGWAYIGIAEPSLTFLKLCYQSDNKKSISESFILFFGQTGILKLVNVGQLENRSQAAKNRQNLTQTQQDPHFVKFS